MEYISAEKFLKQELGVQRIFKEYFDGDSMLFWNHEQLVYWRFEDILINTPLLTEGQLRKFIEDKTGGKIEISWDEDIDIYLVDEEHIQIAQYYGLGYDLLQAYWNVACEIAKEDI